MKELAKLYQDGKEQHAQKQFEKRTVFLGSKQLRPGHSCFEIDNTTKNCVEAKFETEVHFNKPTSIKIVIKENCSYINALNIKNALKVYNRINS